MVLLRGYMMIDLVEADNLPDCDSAFFGIDRGDTSDPLAQVKIGNSVICKTAYINNDESPKWQESYRIPVCHESDTIRVQVKDKEHIGTTLIGEVELRCEDVVEDVLEGWYPLSGCDGRIYFKMEYIPKGNVEYSFEVPDCYFSMNEGGRVILYQDAFCPALPFYESIATLSGDPFIPRNAWVDLYNAINAAERFIYISGWSVCPDTTLLRGCEECDAGDGVGETFGQLLTRKAEEGVRILILIWNEKMSTDVTPGLMGTHDEAMRAYFEGTDVEVAVVPRIRNLEGVASFFQNQFSQTCYTHHQKTIVVDGAPEEGEERRSVIGFVGGLDVTNGRWDTPEHNLFRTLKDFHQADFYNGCMTTSVECGPRQPWHDIHCRIEGPAVRDVIKNFTERWRMQASDKESRLLHINDEEFAIDSAIATEDENLWNIQVFRSITSDSALFDFDRISTIPKRKGKYVDDSIHRAYIHQIRKADRYLYLENQYFLGSAYGWSDENDTKAHHIIPQEICQKISEKIAAGEDFRVYIIIPMFPEGDPASKPVQEILHWQHRTMEMMYQRISQAIAEAELEDVHPTDYLSFFCLGKREGRDELPEDLADPDPDTQPTAAQVREKVRFMIYVHSKMMIVDDDYMIIGSANINQRSMGGTRDSEIAVGVHQPCHTRESCDGEPRGDVHQFRLGLWGEHLGALDEVHIDPGTLDCMKAVREAGCSNWEHYISDEPEAIEGHLLTYPVEVSEDGMVTALEDCSAFPDYEAEILGQATYMPNKLTT